LKSSAAEHLSPNNQAPYIQEKSKQTTQENSFYYRCFTVPYRIVKEHNILYIIYYIYYYLANSRGAGRE